MLLLHLGLALWLWLPAATAVDTYRDEAGWLAAVSEDASSSGSKEREQAKASPKGSTKGGAAPASADLVPAALLLEVPVPISTAGPEFPALPPSPPSSAGSSPQNHAASDAAQRSYYQIVQRKLAAAAARLPADSSGEVRLRFTVLANGAVTAVQLLRRSGNASLDAAALQLPQQAAPLPPPPQSPLTLEVPVRAER